MATCPFCTLAAGRESEDLVPLRTSLVFVVPALRQRRLNRGHMLVLPVAHVTGLSEAPPDLLREVYAAAGRVSRAAREAFGATGATFFQNDDAPDQVLRHLHVHVVPRHAGDGFRMPDPSAEEVAREERRRQAEALRRALS